MASGPISPWQTDGETVEMVADFILFYFSFFKNKNLFILIGGRLITLQYCIGFAIHHESATGIHMFPILNRPLLPPSPFHPSGSSQCTSPKHPVSCIKPGLVIHFIYHIIHVSMRFHFTPVRMTLFYWAPNSLQMVITAMKLKDVYSLERKL